MTWAGQIEADDQYGMVLLARVFRNLRIEQDVARLSLALTSEPKRRQFWLYDYQGFFPEESN